MEMLEWAWGGYGVVGVIVQIGVIALIGGVWQWWWDR